jgi:tRNA(Ile)-lysidine synthase
MRYAFLQEAAATCHADVIATPPTPPTTTPRPLIFNLIRGCGLQGLTGIPPRRGSIVRPLLTTTRAEVEEFLAARGVDHVEEREQPRPRLQPATVSACR